MRELIDYIEQFVPGYAAAVRDTDDARELLETMGAGAGIFVPYGGRFDFSAAAVAGFPRRVRWTPPPELMLIGVDGSGSDMDLYLDEAQQVIARERWAEPHEAQVTVHYASLEQMLFAQAFLAVRMPQYPRRATFSASPHEWTHRRTRLELLEELARELDLAPVPHTGGWSPQYAASDLALAAYQPPGHGLFLEAAAADDRLEPLSRILERELQVVRTD